MLEVDMNETLCSVVLCVVAGGGHGSVVWVGSGSGLELPDDNGLSCRIARIGASSISGVGKCEVDDEGGFESEDECGDSFASCAMADCLDCGFEYECPDEWREPSPPRSPSTALSSECDAFVRLYETSSMAAEISEDARDMPAVSFIFANPKN